MKAGFSKHAWLVIAIVATVLLLDQSLKVWVKTHMFYREIIPIFGADWAFLHFVENDGMAFGKEFNFPHAKLILSFFRIIAATFLAFFIRSLVLAKAAKGLLVSFSLILAGALGNIIDSIFYGLLFSASYTHGMLAEMFPVGGGYAPLLHGKVVDMFYIYFFDFTIPESIPFIGGNTLEFFGSVFNIADVAISIGVLQVLFFHKSFFQTNTEEEEPTQEQAKDKTQEAQEESTQTQLEH